MRNRYIIYIIGIVIFFTTRATAENYYRLHLDGKPGSRQCGLSVRAIERRERQGIAWDERDLELSPYYLQQLSEAGLCVVTSSRWLNTVVVRVAGTRASAEALRNLPFVTQVDMVANGQRINAGCRNALEEDSGKYAVQEGEAGNAALAESSTAPASPLVQVNGYSSLYAAGYRGQGMLIALLDEGFTNVDERPWLNQQVMGARDMYEALTGKNRIYSGGAHGASCLSVMATPTARGVIGTAQEAEYYLIRTENGDSETELEEDMWVAGAELADSLGADIISSSLGYSEFDTGLDDHTWSQLAEGTTHISQGAQAACDKGILVVNAAGNYGNKLWQRLFFPADVRDVLTIGGVTPEGTAASFTSRGFDLPWVKPDVSARATQCQIINAIGNVTSGSGTSYATPLIAGLCASLWSAFPSLTAAEIRHALRQTANQATWPDSITGYGIADFGKAMRYIEQRAEQSNGIETTHEDQDAPCKKRCYDLWGRKRTNYLMICDQN